jgi:hypothetical protein
MDWIRGRKSPERTLRPEGRPLDKELQAEWNRQGESAFEYLILEILEADMAPLVLKETLKAKKAKWVKLLTEC